MMHLVELTCRRFRCLRDLRFAPGSEVNLIRGRNAQGKTSILEAVLYLTTSKSHRTNAETELVSHGEDGFHVTARVQRAGRVVALEAALWRGVKRFKVNGIAQTRISDILGKVNVVLFSPEDIQLIQGSAAHRRLFLDMELSQVSAPYLGALQQFRQVLRQRNELLRTQPVDPNLLEVWDAQFVTHATVLMGERAQFVAELAEKARAAYSGIAGDEELQILYQPDVAEAGDLHRVLRKSRDSDIRRQMTTHGPHRDDVEFRIAGTLARTFASQGQQRTAALAVKLAEAALLHARTGEHPILMLDEALSELDDLRSERLFSSIHPDIQCLITTADLARRAITCPRPCLIFDIDGGAIQPATEEVAP
jgi:DNA replication and repair protein RecF